MAYFSSIDRLPPEIRDLIAQRRLERRTIRAIRYELDGLGYSASNSALARHTKALDDAELAARRSALAPVLVELRGIRTAIETLSDHLGGRKPVI